MTKNWLYGARRQTYKLTKTPILNFLMSTGSHIPFEKLRSRLYVVLSQKWWPKLKLYFKIAKICQKSAKNSQNLPLSDQKNPKFWIFPWVPLLLHIRRHSEEDFRKFSAKTNDKIWSYAPKTAKMTKNLLYKVRAGRPISWPKTLILNFLTSSGSHIPFKKLRSRI